MAIEKSALDKLKIDREPEREGGAGKWILLLLLIIAIGGGAWWWLNRDLTPQVKVTAASEITIGGKQTVLNATGYVEARRNAVVSSKVVGKVTEVLIEEGMSVEKDQVLARLDTVNIDANLKLSQAQLKVSETALGETRADLKEAKLQLDRTRELAADAIATQAALDTAVAQVESLEARLKRQQEEIVVSERQVKLWEQELADRVIRAPFAGVVISKNAQPGEMISPNSAGGGFTRTGICTIVDMASLEIEVDVNESYINRVREGQPVEATLDAYTDWQIPCKVIAIIPTADRQKATVKVRIGFHELDERILPDMGVKVAFKGVEQKAAEMRGVGVPPSALRKDNGKDIVLVVRYDNTIERRAVSVSRTEGMPTLVTAGLTPGEKVVTEGPENLQDGATVKVSSK